MDYSQIGALQPGWGVIWQGGTADASIRAPPFAGPLLIVSMDAGANDIAWIDHVTVQAVLTAWIEDSPDACLPDAVLTALADAIAAWLAAGCHAYLKCGAGASRAAYISAAVHCRVLGISAARALDRIRAQRPVTAPNFGFMAQLNRLWP
jgi:hypothetical protein